MSFKNKSLKRVVYDSVTLIMYNDAVGITDWYEKVRRTAPHIETYFANYSKCLYSVLFYDSGMNLVRRADDIRMPVSLAALQAEVELMTNTSGGIYTEFAIVQFYDLVDYSIPQIEKIYGMNTAMYFIKGRRKALDGELKVARNKLQGNRWPDPTLYDFINAAYTGVFGIAPNPLATELNNGERICWVSSNPRKDFGSPKAGTDITPIVRSERAFCDGVGSPYAQAEGSGQFILGDPISMTFYGYATWYIKPYYSRNVSEWALNSLSQILVYPVTMVGAPAFRAIYVKPVGIDSVHIDYFDTSKYQLESIGMRKGRSPEIIRVFPGPSDISMKRNAYRIRRDQWNMWHREILAFGSTPPYSVKFRLRDLRTNKVGPFSSGTIVPIMNTRYKRIHYMVR